jgi:hypothetical protein
MNGNPPPTARRAWVARQLGLDRNPLRRRTDWLESAIVAGLLAIFLAGTPLAAIAAGAWAHAAGLREQRAQRSWYQASLVLVHSAPRQAAFKRWPPPVRVRARWTQPGGQALLAEVPVPPGSRAGSRVRVWAGRSGPVAGVPLTSGEITARWLLERRRLAAWEYAWTRTGPHWTRRD